MASVTIPRLKQIQSSSDLPANPRIRVKAIDQSASITQRTGIISNIVENGVRINRAYEDSKIDSLSSEANQKYAEWNTKKLQDLKNFQGDPTDAYAQYDIEEKAFFDGLTEDKPNLNDRVKHGYEQNLGKIQDKNRLKVLQQRGFQKEVYERNLYVADIKINKEALSVDASLIKEGDRTSNVKFDRGLLDLKTIIAKNGVRTGSAVEVEDGGEFDHSYEDADGVEIKVKYNPIAQAQLLKEMNAGVTSGIDVLIASGKYNSARNMMKDYAIYVDGRSEARFEKRLQAGETEAEAMDKLGKMRGKTEDQKTRLIDNEKDFKVRTEMIDINHNNSVKMDAQRVRSQKKNWSLVHTEVEKLRASGQLYTKKSITDHPSIKRVLQENRLSSTQMQVLREEFNTPKVSSVKAVTRLTDILLGDHPTYKVGDMSSADIAEAGTGMSDTHKKQLRTAVLKMQGDTGNLDRSSIIHSRASKQLTAYLYTKELIKNNRRGKMNKKSVIILNKSKLELIDYLATQDIGNNASMEKIFEHVVKFVDEKKKQDLFGSEKFFKSSPPPVQKPDSNPLEDLTNTEIFNLQRAYKKETRSTKTPKINDFDFLKWASTQGKK